MQPKYRIVKAQDPVMGMVYQIQQRFLWCFWYTWGSNTGPIGFSDLESARAALFRHTNNMSSKVVEYYDGH
jgi:hypothetical protein